MLSASLTTAAALAGVSEYPPMRTYCIHTRGSRLGACAEIAAQDGNTLAKTLAFAMQTGRAMATMLLLLPVLRLQEVSDQGLQ